MNQIWELENLYRNSYLVNMKLINKVHNGSKIKKIYDTAITPYERIMKYREHINEYDLKIMASVYQEINPFELKQKIEKLKKNLHKTAVKIQHL